MPMAETTGPRKVTTSGGMTVVSLPDAFLEECGLTHGDHVILEERANGFLAKQVEYRTVGADE